jgi:hypothetical protein
MPSSDILAPPLVWNYNSSMGLDRRRRKGVRMKSHFWAVCGLLLLSTYCGCGAQEYERRINAGVNRAKGESKFNVLYATPQDIVGTPVAIRVPTLFTSPAFVENAAVDGKRIDPRRIKPDVVATIPGFKLTYEAFTDDGLPYYLYVGVVNADNVATADPLGGLQVDLNDRFHPNPPVSPADTPCEAPDGRSLPWKSIRVTGDQEFLVRDKTGREQPKTLPGIVDVYSYRTPNCAVVLVWRMPTAVGEKVNVSELAKLVAGCVAIKE